MSIRLRMNLRLACGSLGVPLQACERSLAATLSGCDFAAGESAGGAAVVELGSVSDSRDQSVGGATPRRSRGLNCLAVALTYQTTDANLTFHKE